MGNILRPHQDFLQNNAWLSQSQNSLRYQTSQLGSVVPMIIGTVRQPVNIVNLANYMGPSGGTKGKGVGPLPLGGTNTVAGKGGGKGGGKKGVGGKKNQDYSVDVDYVLCLGQVNSLGQVFANASVAYFSSLPLNFYSGTDGQAPDPLFAGTVGYSGTCHIAGKLDLGMSPVLPNLSVEVISALAGTAGPDFPEDANPGSAISYFLTDPRDGAGWPPALLDNLLPGGTSANGGATWGDYCQAAQLVISVSLDGQQKAADWLDGIAKLTNSAIVWSGKLLRIIPYGDLALSANGANWAPNLTPAYGLTDDDFLSWHDRDGGEPPLGADDPVLVTRTNLSDAHNLYTAQYPDRSNYYNNTIVEVFDQGSIDAFGERPGDSIPAKPFASAAPAQISAQLILQRSQYVRNAPHKFKIGWRYVRLEPMDIVLITDLVCGLDAQAVRVLSVEEDEEGGLTIEAEEITTGASLPPPPPTTTLFIPQFDYNPLEGLGTPLASTGAISMSAPFTPLDPAAQVLLAIVLNRNPLATVSGIISSPPLPWSRRSSYGDPSTLLEVWWADPRGLPAGTNFDLTVNFAQLADHPVLNVSVVDGPVVYTGGSPWDLNGSLPVKAAGASAVIGASGFSTSSVNSLPIAVIGFTQSVNNPLVAGSTAASPPVYPPFAAETFMGQDCYGPGGGWPSLTVCRGAPFAGLQPPPGRYSGVTVVPLAAVGGSIAVNSGLYPWLLIADAIAGM